MEKKEEERNRKDRKGERKVAKKYAFTKQYAYWRQRPLVSIRTGSVRFQPSG